MPVRSNVGRTLAAVLFGRLVAGPRIEDAVRVAGELVSDGRRVALEHVPAPGDDAAAELTALIGEIHAAGLAAACELTLSAEHIGLVATAAAAGLAVAVAGPIEVPGTTVVVPAGEAGAEDRCREHVTGQVRLVQGPAIGRHGAAADLAFVRCLNVLMAGAGRTEIAASDRRLIAIAGERAAWNGRTPESWEYVMPYGVLIDEQRRLVAGGYAVRVAVPSGGGAAALVARRLGGLA